MIFMATNRQPSPRALSPEIPVVSYPTPSLDDLLVVQDVDTRVPGYTALEYGDLHPDQATYPGLKLIFQSPLDQSNNHMWVRRVYAKDRQDEDAYNFAIKYSDSNPAYPIYVRTYTVLRSEYAPLPEGSVDPVFPTAFLVSEEVVRFKGDAEDGALDSLYVKVLRAFETLPGPAVTRYETNETGQTVEVTSQRKLFGPDYAPPTADAVTSFSSEVAEENVITDTVRKLPEVFSAKAFSAEAPDPAPQKFRIASPAITEEETVTGDAVAPTLATGEFAKSETQQTKFTKRKSRTSRSTTGLPKTLTQKQTNEVKQLATVTETLQTGDTSETPSATKDVESEALGDGTYVVRKTEVPEVFSAKTFSIEAPDPAPQKFRIAAPSTTTEETVTGDAVQPTLATGEFAKSEIQQTKFTKRTRKTSRPTTGLPKTLTQKQTTRVKQLATVTETLQTGDTSETPSATKTIESEALGDGTYVVRKTEVPDVFDAKNESSVKQDVLPSRFTANIPTKTVVQTKSGTDASTSLTAGQYRVEKELVSKFEVRESIVSREDSNLPSLSGKDLEEAYNVQIPYTETIATTPSATGSSEIEPLAPDKYLVRTYDPQELSNVLSNFMVTYPTRISLDLPRELTKLQVKFAKTESYSDFENFNSLAGVFKSVTQSDTGSLMVSGTLTPEFAIEYRDVWGSNLSADTHIFFLKEPLNTGAILAKLGCQQWPTFKPQGAVITAKSKTQTKRVSAALSRGAAADPTPGGTQFSKNDSVDVVNEERPVIVTIPPCLHGSITANESESVNNTKQFRIRYAPLSTTGGLQIPEVDVTRSLTVNLQNQVNASLPSTSPPAIPKSGKYLTDCRVEFFKFGWFIVQATVFDAAQLS
jgi:hypothetical protein